jgi:hypothetical protein
MLSGTRRAGLSEKTGSPVRHQEGILYFEVRACSQGAIRHQERKVSECSEMLSARLGHQ